MRTAVAHLGKNPKIIEPLVPVDLVVDHSVQVDEFGSAGALLWDPRAPTVGASGAIFGMLGAGLLLEPKLQLAYVLGLGPMLVGLYVGTKVHADMTREGMLRVVGTLLVLSGAMLFLKVAI